jgi:hypothetical protein
MGQGPTAVPEEPRTRSRLGEIIAARRESLEARRAEREARREAESRRLQQAVRARSGGQLTAAEAARVAASAINKAGSFRRLIPPQANIAKPGRRSLPKRLTSEKRGRMTKRGGMSLGR